MEDILNTLFCCDRHVHVEEQDGDYKIRRRGRSRTPRGSVNARIDSNSRNFNDDMRPEMSTFDNSPGTKKKKHRKVRRRRSSGDRQKASRKSSLHFGRTKSETIAETNDKKTNKIRKKNGNKLMIGDTMKRQSTRDCSLTTDSVDSTLDSSIDTRESTFEIILEPCDSFEAEKFGKLASSSRLLRNLSFISRKVHGGRTRIRNRLGRQ